MYKILGIGYKIFVKPIFFQINPEKVHERMILTGNKLGKISFFRKIFRVFLRYDNPSLEQKVDGIFFKNPVGLSAGFDKNAELLDIISSVGFGFEVVGSVTDKAYEGNPGTRLYRLKKSKGIVVYYGLKNIGVDKIISRIMNRKVKDYVLGVSIAKTNCDATANDEAGIEDYYSCVQKLEKSEVGDFYTINISCPNTFGGEPFTEVKRLENLMKKLSELEMTKPVYVKMPIDFEWEEFKKLLDVLIKYNVHGVVISNLTKDRKAKSIKDNIPDEIKGGISGKPTQEKSNMLISKTYKEYGEKLTIIGVGGIFSAEDAYEKIKSGASLVQLITGLIYEGPQLVAQINKNLVKLVKKDGFNNISEAIGINAN